VLVVDVVGMRLPSFRSLCARGLSSGASLRSGMAFSIGSSWVVLAGLCLLYVSWQWLHWLPFSRELSGDALLLSLNVFAIGAVVCAWRRVRGWKRMRRAWLWVGLALLGQACGEAAQIYYEAAGISIYPSLAEPLYLSFYPLLLVGVLSFPAGRRSGGQALELALDSAIVTLGGGMVFVYLILGPSVIAAATPLETIVSVAYPVGDLILLLALGAALMRGTTPATERSLRLMAAAIACFAVADLIYGYIVLHSVYHGGDQIEIAYACAFACFSAAALAQRADRSPGRRSASRTVVARSSWLPYLAIGAAIAVMIARAYGKPFFPDQSIAIVIAMTFTVVMVRQIISQTSLRHSRERLAEAQRIAQIGTWEWDLEQKMIDHAEADMSGADSAAQRMTLQDTIALIHPDDRENVQQLARAAVENDEPFECEMRVVRSDSEVRTLLTRGQAHRRGGRVRSIRGTFQDITDRKRMEIQLQYQADHDPLTGLYNRRRFGDELERALYDASRYERHGALLMLDLDDFKVLNDTRGHAAGDAALKALAQAIRDRVRASDVVARLGGDEFAVLFPDAHEQHALAIAESIRDGVAAHHLDPPLHITGGIVSFDEHWNLAADDAMVAADIALYEAKEKGKDQVQLYRGTARAAVAWVDRIRAALHEDRFILYSQPMLDMHRDEHTYSELLLRMISEDGALIPPSAFLPTAERYGLISDIDLWVTRQGLRLAMQGERVSINLSAKSIGNASILVEVRAAISAGVDPHDVIFEITESAAMSNMQDARSFTEALVALGCAVALDDFGTGFGSFTYLKHLPSSYLKIDMEFVRDMVNNTTDRHVVASIAKIAHSLGMQTIAEGVEDAETLQLLRDYGVDLAQGFHVGRPSPILPPSSSDQRVYRHHAKQAA
jgi:diguanylate cyclase (GGDEF)-like protein/PAS domain S-box-containing protein